MPRNIALTFYGKCVIALEIISSSQLSREEWKLSAAYRVDLLSQVRMSVLVMITQAQIVICSFVLGVYDPFTGHLSSAGSPLQISVHRIVRDRSAVIYGDMSFFARFLCFTQPAV